MLTGSQFLEAVFVQCFQSSDLVRKAVETTLDCCDRFARRLDEAQEPVLIQQLPELSREFDRQQMLLFTVMSRQAATGRAPHLARLLTRLGEWAVAVLPSYVRRLQRVHVKAAGGHQQSRGAVEGAG